MDVLEDARAIRAVYGQDFPELDRARPVSVSFSSPGGVSQVKCGLILRNFPGNPPKKYFGDNAIYIEITFDGAEDVRLTGSLSEIRAQIVLRREEEGIEFELYNSTLSLKVTCEVASLSRISSYVDDSFGPKV